VIRSVFEDAYNYMKSGHLLRQVINKIVEGLTSTRRRTATSSATSTSRSCATCRTPATPASSTPRARHPVHGRHGGPQLGEKIMDPACGTGGFLTCAIETCASST
jgi:type I restriction enzyme M protein